MSLRHCPSGSPSLGTGSRPITVLNTVGGGVEPEGLSPGTSARGPGAAGDQCAIRRLRLCTVIASTRVSVGMEHSASLPGGLPGRGGPGRHSDGRVRLPVSQSLGRLSLLAHLTVSAPASSRPGAAPPPGHRQIHGAAQHETAHSLTRVLGQAHSEPRRADLRTAVYGHRWEN